jgi:prepilin-type N-terminal cleavage/methylation domain-containing protein
MKLIRQKIKDSGFTLIELIVVMALIGILSMGIFANYLTQSQKTRDARREDNLNQYRIALENYSIKTSGLFPSYTSIIDASGSLCTTLNSGTVPNMSSCVQDPRQGTTYFYRYQSDGSGGGGNTATKYILWARLQYEPNQIVYYWYLCSDGRVGSKPTNQPTTADCWF